MVLCGHGTHALCVRVVCAMCPIVCANRRWRILFLVSSPRENWQSKHAHTIACVTIITAHKYYTKDEGSTTVGASLLYEMEMVDKCKFMFVCVCVQYTKKNYTFLTCDDGIVHKLYAPTTSLRVYDSLLFNPLRLSARKCVPSCQRTYLSIVGFV